MGDYNIIKNKFSKFAPKVSVIIPVYNVEKYLPECLDSVINQTLKDIEIICVNDGSPDNSLEILKDYANRDKRITIIDQKNQGLSCSRNNAMEVATGEYIMFLDSDDCIRKDACELLYDKVKKNELDALFFAGENFENGTNRVLDSSYYQFKYLPEEFKKDKFRYLDCYDFIEKMAVSSCLCIYNRRLILNNNIKFPDGICYEDNLFFFTIIIKSIALGICQEKLYFRRIHNQSITQNSHLHFGDLMNIIEKIDNLLVSNNINQEVYIKVIENYANGIYYRYNSFADCYKEIYKQIFIEFIKKYKFFIKRRKKIYLFGIPVYYIKQKNCKFVHKLFNLPIFGIKMKDYQKTIKIYILGIPVLKIKKTNNSM